MGKKHRDDFRYQKKEDAEVRKKIIAQRLIDETLGKGSTNLLGLNDDSKQGQLL